jgi:hypothetical protein
MRTNLTPPTHLLSCSYFLVTLELCRLKALTVLVGIYFASIEYAKETRRVISKEKPKYLYLKISTNYRLPILNIQNLNKLRLLKYYIGQSTV